MQDKLKGMLIAVAAIAALVVGGVAVAGAAGGGEDGPERAITGTALERASAAALAETKGGTVTDTELGDEEGAYEVEVTLAGGREVDVHLDNAFSVLGTEAEKDERNELSEG